MVAKAHVHSGYFVRAEVLVLGRVLHVPERRFGLLSPARDRKNVRLQRQNGQAVVQSALLSPGCRGLRRNDLAPHTRHPERPG